jgi:hypothetical protein
MRTCGIKIRFLLLAAVAILLDHSCCFDREECTQSAKTTKMPSLYDLEVINLYNTCTVKTFPLVDMYFVFILCPFTH